MWKWISENLSEGFNELDINDKDSAIHDMKVVWLKAHRFTRIIKLNCFFCEYCGRTCSACPAYVVDKHFGCMDTKYDYCYHPKAFYRKLLELDKKRTGKK